ncbi:MAG: hypothetical protein WCD53_05200 [Microcoleus sp.]
MKDKLNELIQQFRDDEDCDNDDLDYYDMQEGYVQAESYSVTPPPKQPDIRKPSSLLARANELGAQVIDGALWVGTGVAGFVLLALEVIARLLGLDLRFRP